MVTGVVSPAFIEVTNVEVGRATYFGLTIWYCLTVYCTEGRHLAVLRRICRCLHSPSFPAARRFMILLAAGGDKASVLEPHFVATTGPAKVPPHPRRHRRRQGHLADTRVVEDRSFWTITVFILK